MDSVGNLLKSAKNYLDSEKFSQAIGLYEKALKEATPEERANIKRELAFCYLRSGDLDLAFIEAKEAEENFVRLEDEIEQVRTQLLITRLLLEMGKSEEARALSMEVYESYKGTANHKIVGLSQKFLGRAFAQLGDYGKAEDFLRDSLTSFRCADDEGELLISYNYLANVNFATSDYKQALMNLEKGLGIAQKRGSKRNEILILGNIGTFYRKTGKWSLASKTLQAYLEKCEELNDSLLKLHGLISLGRLKILQRQPAEDLLKRALTLAQEHGYEREEAMSLESLGNVAKENGDLELARDYYQRTLDIGRRLGQKDLINQVQRRRAELFLMEGQNLEEASKCCAEALKISQSLGDRLEEGCCYRVQALISEVQGNLEETRESFEKAIRILRSLKQKFELGRTFLEQGRFTATALKEREQGLKLLQEADRLFSEIGPGCQYHRGRAKLQMAKAERASSHPNEALDFIAQAEAIFSELDEKGALKETAKLRAQVESRLDRATDSEENPYLLLKELSLKPLSEAGLRSHLKTLLHTITERVRADQGFVAYRDTDGLKVAERVKLREEEAEKALHLLATNSLEPGRLIVKLSADGKFSSLKVGAFLVMPLGLRERLDGIVYLAQRPGRIGWRQEDVHFFVAASEHIHRVVADLRVEGLEAENLVLRAYQIADRYGFSRLITDDKRMKEVLRVVDKVKNAREPVLLTGESGTGKKLIARLIHCSSQRKGMPFMAINCANISDNLLESELFGHERGAFTDARTQHKGLFELADGGTVFLDEVGELSRTLQPKLLRFLETKSFRRVGGTKALKVDVRIIAATNKDLHAMVKSGKFSDALFYRLNCFTMDLPSLRQRRGDIPLLVNYFLERLNQANHTRRTITPEAMEMFMERKYPGNVRELENLIKKAVILADGDMITPDLGQESEKGGTSKVAQYSNFSLKERVEELEKKVISEELARHRWNKSITAKILGLTWRGLENKIRRYNLTKPQL